MACEPIIQYRAAWHQKKRASAIVGLTALWNPSLPAPFGRFKPVAHSFLFATYHLESPWMIPVRTIGLLPLIYVTSYTKSVRPGIIAHCLVNLANFVESISNRVRS